MTRGLGIGGLLCAAATVLGAAPAYAGAWTQPQGQGLAIETLFGWTGEGAPYGGPAVPREYKLGAQTYVEYGLADGLTAVGQATLDRYALSAPTRDAYAGLDYSGGGLRARVWSNDAWTFAMEASAYMSSARDASRPAQAGNTGPAADIRALAGLNATWFGLPLFVDAQAGYRLRTEGPPGEFHGDLTLGVQAAPRVQILAQSFNILSNGAGAPGFAAWESHVGQLSLVYALDANWSVQIGGFGTLYRRETNSEYGGLVAVWRRF